jgi:hypothetical protein
VLYPEVRLRWVRHRPVTKSSCLNGAGTPVLLKPAALATDE